MTATEHKSAETARRARAVLYLRVSTARQATKGGEAEGYSIPAQRKECTRRAQLLNADIVEEFIDAGASARSADRPALQAMLERLKEGGIDYVIVHKIDRLARDRADDVTIGLAIHRSGATLVSTTEAVDDSPSGTLLHGIMAAIAEFYSKNLAAEARKGLHEKARRGGTPGYAPLGYLNVIHRSEGVENRTVEIDEQRAPHIAWAFETYATGQISISELTDELAKRGMKSRPTAKFVGSPMTRSMVHRMLSNRYYTGQVVYGGIEYPGKHPTLIDEDTFWCVQAILSNRRIAGDRAWKRQQYLKGTLYCQRCGERLSFGHSTGRNGDEYRYFFCLGRHRKRNDCDLPYLPADAVELAVLRQWQQVHFRPELCEQVGAVLDEEFDRRRAGDLRLLQTQRRRVVELERQKQKLIDAYLADALPVEDLKPRQDTVQRELADARRLIEGAEAKHDDARQRLNLSLKLLERADRMYRTCSDEQRATLNLVAFTALYLDMNNSGDPFVAEAVLNPEFATLIQMATAVVGWQPAPTPDKPPRARLFSQPRPYTRTLHPGRHCHTAAASLTVERQELTGVSRSGDTSVSNLTYLAERVVCWFRTSRTGVSRHGGLMSREIPD